MLIHVRETYQYSIRQLSWNNKRFYTVLYSFKMEWVYYTAQLHKIKKYKQNLVEKNDHTPFSQS